MKLNNSNDTVNRVNARLRRTGGMFLRVMLVCAGVSLGLHLRCVPEEEYREKVENIESMEEKNEGFDLKGWRYQEKRSDSLDITHRYYHYPCSLDSPPVFLFIHGLNLDGRTFLNLSDLSAKFELVAYDLPEQTDIYQGEFEDFIEIVNDFIDRMDYTRLCICGVSFGGGIALRLAATRTDLEINGLVLSSIAITDSSRLARRQRKTMSKLVARQPDYRIYWLMETIINRSIDEYEKDSARQPVLSILRMKHPAFFRQIARSIDDYDAREDARKVNCPTLILMGTEDNLFDPKEAYRTKEYIDNATVKIIEGGSHAMVYVRGEQIAEIIDTFCATNGI
jgi:pimeloyl-ACP methyl ester carboxylesterase